MAEPSSRIAIKFSSPRAPPKPHSRPPPPSALGKRHRADDARAAYHSDSDHSDDERGKYSGRLESITTFGGDDDGGAAARGERVIARQQDQGWRAQMKQRYQQQHRTEDSRDASREQEAGWRDGDEPEKEKEDGTQWGLVVTKKKKQKDGPESAGAPSEAKDDAPNAKQEEPTARTADEEAMDALLDNRPAKKQAVIIKISEDDAFQRDHSDAPDESTLDDYKDMPVEEFGAALLRGMGWNGDLGPKPKEIARRPQGLGLGSKALKGEEDLGGWDTKAGHKKSARPPRLDDYRRQESKRKEERNRGYDSYKREKEREKERERYDRDRDHRQDHRDRDRDRDRDRNRDRDRRDGPRR